MAGGMVEESGNETIMDDSAEYFDPSTGRWNRTATVPLKTKDSCMVQINHSNYCL